MRTTLNVDDDVLTAARSMARHQGVPVGTVLSGLARKGLEPRFGGRIRNGIHLFPIRKGAGRVTPYLVKELLEESD